MRTYTARVKLTMKQYDGVTAFLSVIRLPTSWYSAVWSDEKNFKSVEQVPPRSDIPWKGMSDDDFLAHVRMLYGFLYGLDFDVQDYECRAASDSIDVRLDAPVPDRKNLN